MCQQCVNTPTKLVSLFYKPTCVPRGNFNCVFPYSKLLLELLLVRVCVHPSELCISHRYRHWLLYTHIDQNQSNGHAARAHLPKVFIIIFVCGAPEQVVAWRFSTLEYM